MQDRHKKADYYVQITKNMQAVYSLFCINLNVKFSWKTEPINYFDTIKIIILKLLYSQISYSLRKDNNSNAVA